MKRNPDGTFARGNAGGPGNPHASRVAELRSALLDAVSEDDVKDVARALVEQATGGNVQAARVLLNRLMGKPKADVEILGTPDPLMQELMMRSEKELDEICEASERQRKRMGKGSDNGET